MKRQIRWWRVKAKQKSTWSQSPVRGEATIIVPGFPELLRSLRIGIAPRGRWKLHDGLQRRRVTSLLSPGSCERKRREEPLGYHSSNFPPLGRALTSIFGGGVTVAAAAGVIVAEIDNRDGGERLFTAGNFPPPRAQILGELLLHTRVHPTVKEPAAERVNERRRGWSGRFLEQGSGP